MTTDSTQRALAPFPNTAIILAGGLGTRLRKTISDRPKVLALADGRPFLSYLLMFVSQQGIEEVILSIGHLGQQVRNFVNDGSHWGLKVKYSDETKPLGTGGALRLACKLLDEDSFFAMNGDTIFQINLKDFWVASKQLSGLATIALREVNLVETSQRGCVRLANDGRILNFDEKPDLNQPKDLNNTYLSSAGVYIIEKPALDSIHCGEKASLERDIFPRLVQNASLKGIIQQGYFADIGTPESLAKFESDLERGILQT